MSASPLLTINAAADQLQRDRRTIAAHLRDIPPDDKDAQGRLRWRLATIVRALSNERPQQGDCAAADDVEAASEALAAGLKRVQAAKDIEQRRNIVIEDVGRLVGRLDAAMERAAADRRPSERAILDIVRNKVVGDAIGVLMRACEWKVEHHE
jgi:hypothetical protein